MTKNLATLTLVLGLCAAPIFTTAHADEVPEYAFNKYYDNCMGGETAQQDLERDKYCGCIRDKMKTWTPEQFQAMSAEMSKSGSPQATPDLEAMAKECIAKALK
jgi:hypothetical protein